MIIVYIFILSQQLYRSLVPVDHRQALTVAAKDKEAILLKVPTTGVWMNGGAPKRYEHTLW